MLTSSRSQEATVAEPPHRLFRTVTSPKKKTFNETKFLQASTKKPPSPSQTSFRRKRQGETNFVTAKKTGEEIFIKRLLVPDIFHPPKAKIGAENPQRKYFRSTMAAAYDNLLQIP